MLPASVPGTGPPANKARSSRSNRFLPLKPPREAHPLGIETLSAKAARDPQSAFVLNELANQLARHGRLLEAEDKYHQALTVDPHFAIQGQTRTWRLSTDMGDADAR